MAKNKSELAIQGEMQISEKALFDKVSAIIENRIYRAQVQVNQESIFMFWEVGKYIGSVLLGGERAGYGKQIVVTLAQQLSWSHFIALLPLKTGEAFMFYANDAVARRLVKRELRKQISRKAYERREIANSQLTEVSAVPFNVFKDPYLLDVFGLKDNYLEADLEKAILAELEAFILEYGNGFTFVARQKRMTMDGDDFRLDLLFFYRILKRLVAIELKIGKFKPSYTGQMRFYLKWLSRYDMNEGENPSIGIILCTEASRDQIELLELDKEGVAVAEYWTQLPAKREFERKISEIYEEAKERLERRKLLPDNKIRNVDYFYEPKEGDDE